MNFEWLRILLRKKNIRAYENNFSSDRFLRNAHNACLYAIAMAKKMKAKILLMHAFDTPLIFADVPIVTTDMDYAVFRESAAKNIKKYHKKIASLANGVKI